QALRARCDEGVMNERIFTVFVAFTPFGKYFTN
ncbi:MAG: hypothetical protein RL741_1232, partial [Actinomycetota bacterium]